MTKLNKSIRHEMRYYGPRIRAGHYGVVGTSSGVGVIPDDFAFIRRVCCDVENGVVTDIRLYAVNDAMEERDYNEKSVNITEPVESYVANQIGWDDMIDEIESIVREYIAEGVDPHELI